MIKALTAFVQHEFASLANPDDAGPMAAYMKTDMPFYGIKKPARMPVCRSMVKQFPATSRKAYRDAVLALWNLPHREEKYAALQYARSFKAYIDAKSLPLYQRLIREGAWWDLVDEVATQILYQVIKAEPATAWKRIDGWVDHRDMWLRRSSIICQVKLKDETDTKRLFDICQRRMHEDEFFIRKAIGWALRQHAYTDADAVRAFLKRHEGELSKLSYREAAKHL